MKEIVIKIYEAAEGGYMFDIYDSVEKAENDGDSIDGGLCTSTIGNALEMAASQAKDLIERAGRKAGTGRG